MNSCLFVVSRYEGEFNTGYSNTQTLLYPLFSFIDILSGTDDYQIEESLGVKQSYIVALSIRTKGKQINVSLSHCDTYIMDSVLFLCVGGTVVCCAFILEVQYFVVLSYWKSIF